MHYSFERKVESVIKKSVFEGRGFGAKMTVEQLIAKQTRIERCCTRYNLLVQTRCNAIAHRASSCQEVIDLNRPFCHTSATCLQKHYLPVMAAATV